MAQKIFTDESLATFVDETKAYIDNAVSTKADKEHTHSWNNLDIKDMYGVESNEILKSQELQFKYTDLDGCMAQVSLVSPIVPDKVYTIEFDGICYEGLSAQNPAGQIYIEFSHGIEEKIAGILQVDGMSFVLTHETTDSVHTVAIREEKLKQIPSKYLPTDYIKELINDVIITALNTEV